MPELPEVETVARGLADRISGLVAESVRLNRTDIVHGNGGAIQQLAGLRLEEVCRWGKQVRLSWHSERTSLTMYVHLGMTGRLIVVRTDEPVERHTHLRVTFRHGNTELRFCDPRRFGGIWLVREGECDGRDGWVGRRLPPVGADPLHLSIQAMRGLLARRRRIKALLLDQRPISGLGNIYCDEALHRARIHPLVLAADLDAQAVRRLHQAIRRVLNEAVRAGGSSISDYRNAENARGRYQESHRVYDREGQPCRTCGQLIEKLVVAGRGTHLCPACQPPPKTQPSRSALAPASGKRGRKRV